MATITSPGVVTVGGLTFNAVDASGVEWVFDAIDGWHDGPSVNVDQTPRVASHGTFFQPGRRGGRTITLAGWLYSDNRQSLAIAVDSLAALLADGSSSPFAFVDADLGSRWVAVQLLDTPDIQWDDNPSLCLYQMQFYAADSYRYGVLSSASTGFGVAPIGAGLVFPLLAGGTLDFGAQGTSGVVTLSNLGNASSAVRFTVTGPTPVGGFTITDASTGKTITYLGAVPAGSSLVLDGADGTVIINGTADRLGDTIVQAWPTVPANSTRDFLFTPNGGSTTAILTAETYSTFW